MTKITQKTPNLPASIGFVRGIIYLIFFIKIAVFHYQNPFNMTQKIANISILVHDYDEAIAFYTQKLNFTLVEDTSLSETKRWVIVAPPGATESRLLLAKAKNETQQKYVGNQTGGRVFLFLHTDNFWRDYEAMVAQGVKFVREPSEEVYGTVAVFEDLYGNLWDFVAPKVF